MSYKTFLKFMLIAIVGGGMISCSVSSGSYNTKDSWYRPPPSELRERDEWMLLDSSKIHEVTPSMESSAETLLESVSYVIITNEQADKLLGRHLTSIPHTRIFLVRSLYLNKATGGYYVSILNGYLWVHHASLGREHTSMKRQALVLQLEKGPKEVFVSCSMAE